MIPRSSLTDECLAAAEGIIPGDAPGPDGKRGKRPVGIAVMRNAFVEKYLARAHPITPGVWFGPFVIAGLWFGITGPLGVLRTLGLFAAGVIVTTLIEYNIHRFLFHREPTNEAERLRHFLYHGYHHEFPNDPMRLVLPPLGAWPLGIAVGLVYYFVLGPMVWLQVYAGTAAGYIAYDWIHYYTHHFNPKWGPGKWIKRYHMLHHHDSPRLRYGITSPLWDLVFGTFLGTDKLARAHAPKKSAPAPAE